MSDFVNLFGVLDGEQFPGGCEKCDAYQMIVPISQGMWSLEIYHDDWCPFLKAIEGRNG